jgi:cell division protein FtsB
MSALKIIDRQVLKLVDYLIELHKKNQTNLDLASETAFGLKFYPHNRNIITHMRGKDVKGGKGKSAPHLLIINIGQAFNVDFNFFYNESIEVKNAFLSKKKTTHNLNKEFTDDLFKEIERKIELSNKEEKGKETNRYYKEAETELLHIKTHLNKSITKETLIEKRTEILEMFDKVIFLSKRKVDAQIVKTNLELKTDQLEKENEQNKNTKSRLEANIQKLNTDLIECNKMAFEAQKGQTDALKELLAMKNKD